MDQYASIRKHPSSAALHHELLIVTGRYIDLVSVRGRAVKQQHRRTMIDGSVTIMPRQEYECTTEIET